MKGRLYDPALGRFLSADPFVQSPLWSQGLNRYSYGYNNPLSGSDPSGFNWLSDLLSSDSSGYQGAAIFAGAAITVGGAGLSALVQSGTLSGPSAAGGAVGIAHAAYGLSDPGANATYAAPTGELGSGAGLYNEGAGAAPSAAQGATACYPACSLNPRAEFDTQEQWEAYARAYEIGGNLLLGVGGLARWLAARAAARAAAGAVAEAAASAGKGALAIEGGVLRAGSSWQGALLKQSLQAEVVAGAKMPHALTGYTRHGLNQAISRDGVGVSAAAIRDAFKNPLSIAGQQGGTFEFVGTNARIVLNESGQVVTAWARSSAGWRFVP
jgi:hypothetical protein